MAGPGTRDPPRGRETHRALAVGLIPFSLVAVTRGVLEVLDGLAHPGRQAGQSARTENQNPHEENDHELRKANTTHKNYSARDSNIRPVKPPGDRPRLN